jgi:hypothetical protein
MAFNRGDASLTTHFHINLSTKSFLSRIKLAAAVEFAPTAPSRLPPSCSVSMFCPNPSVLVSSSFCRSPTTMKLTYHCYYESQAWHPLCPREARKCSLGPETTISFSQPEPAMSWVSKAWGWQTRSCLHGSAFPTP